MGLTELRNYVFQNSSYDCVWSFTDLLVPMVYYRNDPPSVIAKELLKGASIVNFGAKTWSSDDSLLNVVSTIYFNAEFQQGFGHGQGIAIRDWFEYMEQNMTAPSQLDQFEDQLIDVYVRHGARNAAPGQYAYSQPFIIYITQRNENLQRVVTKIVAKAGRWGGSGVAGILAGSLTINIDPENSTIAFLSWWADRSHHPLAPLILWVDVINQYYDSIMKLPDESKTKIISLINNALIVTLDTDCCLSTASVGYWALARNMGGLLKPAINAMRAYAARPQAPM